MSEIKVNSIKGVGASSAAITVNNTDGTCTANISSVNGGQIGGRNMIVNGSMQCNQRGNQTGITGATYTLDRFRLNPSSLGTYSVNQLGGSDELINTGQRNSMKVDCTTADASPAASDLLLIQTPLEGLVTNRLCWGTSNAKKAVLSFWAKADINGWSSGTKDFVVEIQASDSQEFSIVCQLATAGTWQKFTVPIDAKTSGAIAYDNTESMGINWWLDAGSNYKGGTGVTGWSAKGNSGGVRAAGQTLAVGAHTDNNFYLTGVQFELNDTGVATDFEHRSFGQELALCQRYYYRWTAGATNRFAWMGMSYSTTTCFGIVKPFPVEMRTAPTCSVSGTYKPFGSDGSTSGHTAFSSRAIDRATKYEMSSSGWGGATGIQEGGRPVIVEASEAEAYMDASAEL